MHEHVFVLDPQIQQNCPDEWGSEEQRVADAVARLNELKSRGANTIVDLTVIGLGRYVPRVLRIAEQTQLQIVVATGIYTYRNLPLYFHFRGPVPAGESDPIVEMFVRDITDGIADTGVKARILKCCTDEPGVTPDVERILVPLPERIAERVCLCRRTRMHHFAGGSISFESSAGRVLISREW
jgi:phosphotriesterase-related protein